jgi:hypothetical protein
MKGLRSIRPLPRDSLRGIEFAKVGKKLPKFEIIDPESIYVEDSYQRAIMKTGQSLIRKICENFDWSHYKPPVCVRVKESGNVLVCIDGQHTATASACHPDIEKIPVMVVDAADVPKRAAAFVGHNKDRIGLTTVMIYHAELAAQDPDAVVIDRALRATGASIPKRAISTSGKEKHPVGVTMSIGAIRAIAKRQGQDALERVLRLMVAVGRGPIKSVEITAAALIFAIYPPPIDDKLRKIIMRKTAEEWTALGYAESVASGKAIAVAVAAMWCRELGVEAPDPGVKGNATDHARLIVGQAQKKIAPAPKPIPPPPAPAAKGNNPAPKGYNPPVSAAAPAPAAPQLIERNGVKVDLELGAIFHRKKAARLSDEGATLVGALARVMPAMLVNDDLARKVWGSAIDSTNRIDELVKQVAPALASVDLKVNTVPKLGRTLAAVGG